MATAQSAKTQFVLANGIKFAYRRLGNAPGVPLVMLMHFRGNMDFWDPLLLNELAANRAVIIFDNSGIGKSGGEVPLTIKGWAENAISVIRALGFEKIDLLGFSMGGYTAQMVALNAPGLVRRLILAGTGPSEGADQISATDLLPREVLSTATATDLEEVQNALRVSFFSDDNIGAVASKAYWDRISAGRDREDRHGIFLDEAGTKRQIEAMTQWHNPDPTKTNSYHRLHELKMPVFIANGNNDLLIPTANSWLFMERIAGSHLHIYPGAGHGFLYQHAQLFAAHVNLFLNEKSSVL